MATLLIAIISPLLVLFGTTPIVFAEDFSYTSPLFSGYKVSEKDKKKLKSRFKSKSEETFIYDEETGISTPIIRKKLSINTNKEPKKPVEEEVFDSGEPIENLSNTPYYNQYNQNISEPSKEEFFGSDAYKAYILNKYRAMDNNKTPPSYQEARRNSGSVTISNSPVNPNNTEAKNSRLLPKYVENPQQVKDFSPPNKRKKYPDFLLFANNVICRTERGIKDGMIFYTPHGTYKLKGNTISGPNNTYLISDNKVWLDNMIYYFDDSGVYIDYKLYKFKNNIIYRNGIKYITSGSIVDTQSNVKGNRRCIVSEISS